MPRIVGVSCRPNSAHLIIATAALLLLVSAMVLTAGVARAGPAPRLQPCTGQSALPANTNPTPKTALALRSEHIAVVPKITGKNYWDVVCDVSGFAIAASDNGELRLIYKPDGHTPDDHPSPPGNGADAERAEFIDPVILATAQRVANLAAQRIAEYRRDHPEAARIDEQEILNQFVRNTQAAEDVDRATAAAHPLALSGPHARPEASDSEIDPGVIRLLIYAHGGKVSHSEAVYSAETLVPIMMRDGFVPVFLLWNSDFTKSYLDRLCCVRRGAEETYAVTRFYFAPTRLISDVGSGIASAPENIAAELTRYGETNIRDFDLYNLNYDEISTDCVFFEPVAKRGIDISPDLCKRHVNFPDFAETNGEIDKRKPRDKAEADRIVKDKNRLNGQEDNAFTAEDVRYGLLTPVWLTTTALLPDVGAKAWDDMVRRTRLAFDEEWTQGNSSNYHCFTYEGDQAAAQGRRGNVAATTTSNGTLQYGEKPIDESRIEPRQDEPQACPSGGFTRFFNAMETRFAPEDLRQENAVARFWVCEGDKQYTDWKQCSRVLWVPVTIEYYGHSMGAIVGDELISRYPAFPWSRIVYMAAADTIRDFKVRTARVLIAKACEAGGVGPCADARPELRFYSLSLHPLNESREKEAGGAVPQGSLLEWIDELFNGPRSLDDRTLGKWKNLEETLPTWDRAVLQKTSVRVFPRQRELLKGDKIEQAFYGAQCDRTPPFGSDHNSPPAACYPLKHGDFNLYTFWRPAYYEGLLAPLAAEN